MKTLIFCTGFAKTIDEWELKHSRWFNAIETSKLNVDTLLIPDDGSPELPSWEGVDTILEGTLSDQEPTARGVIYSFKNNLGRQEVYVYPGWHRSFMLAAEYAKKYSYEKVIHVEADAFVISDRMQNYINDYADGWTTFWCSKYQIPETSIQIIAGSGLQSLYDLIDKPYSLFSGHPADAGQHHRPSWLSYVVNKDFYGNRWGEDNTPTPKNADFTCQINYADPCWWLDTNS